MIRVLKYQPDFKEQWDQLVTTGKNVSFLFRRDFMEYHSDRFEDYSLIFFDDSEIIALMPANISGKTVYSHQGLTYGGFVLKRDMKFRTAMEVFHQALKYLYHNGIEDFYLKPIPRIYNALPADELDWALTMCKADLYRRDTTLAISKIDKIPFQTRRLRAIKRAAKLEPEVRQENSSESFTNFWNNALIPNLWQRHGLKPVHTVEEIIMLAERFPENIRQYNLYIGGSLMAGTTLFINPNVVHAQYIASTGDGKDNGALDYLFNHLINRDYSNHTYVDFGNCNEENGTLVNYGLMEWKEGFGARAVSHDFYLIQTKNNQFLNRKF